jgi:hypothetical protein
MLTGDKIKDIFDGAAVGFIKLGVSTSFAYYRGEFSGLHVENPGKKTAGGGYGLNPALPVTAFRTCVFCQIHIIL